MTRSRLVRLAAGLLVLMSLAAIAVVLVPPYVANWKLQHYVNQMIEDPATTGQTASVIRAKVVNKAASLGVPLHPDDVRVVASESAVRIDALYVVHVDVAGYTVDLHFRPAAGGS